MKLSIPPQRILKQNLYLILFFLIMNLSGFILVDTFEITSLSGWKTFFDFDKEYNAPTIYSALAFFVISVMTHVIGSKYRLLNLRSMPWLGLSIIFCFFAMDEIFQIHEGVSIPILMLGLGGLGFFHFAWVLPYGFALIIFIFAYSRFLFELPQQTSTLFLISGAIFVTGALGMELIAGKYLEIYGQRGTGFFVLTTIEELFEMIGLAVFTYALLLHLGELTDAEFSGEN